LSERCTLPALNPEHLTRRELALRLLGTAGLWTLGGNHPVWGHLLNEGPSVGQNGADLADGHWKPLFLSPEQNEALDSVSEAMVPGSSAALVSRFIDLLLSVDSPAVQQKFLNSLDALEREAKRQFGKGIQELSMAQRDSLLDAVSTSPETTPTRESFEDLKAWIAGAYYSSEIGMKELGWTANRFFPSFPGCAHTDEDRS
jgi:hypothetical protein